MKNNNMNNEKRITKVVSEIHLPFVVMDVYINTQMHKMNCLIKLSIEVFISNSEQSE